jgi:signal transduction histidine kinase
VPTKTEPTGQINAGVPGEPFVPGNWLEGGAAVVDGQGNVAEINDSLAAWLNQSRADVVGKPLWTALGAIAEQWRKPLGDVLENLQPFAKLSLSYSPANDQPTQYFAVETARSGGMTFLRLNSTLPPLAELEEGNWDEHLANDSARLEMYMRLLRAEAQLDRLMRHWPCVVFSQRPDFSLQFASSNIRELTGIPAEDWSSQPGRFWQLVHEADAVELQQQCKRAVQTGSDMTLTFRIRHALTGRVAYILEHRQPTISQNGLLLGYEVVWLDVTRQTIAEKRLSTAAWKETLAVLTLGMAHDFRNIMAGIHSLSESFLAEVTERHPFQEGLGLIKKSSMQASQLVNRMINLHLGQTGERNYQDLNEIARDLLELVGKILPRRIQVGTELAEGQLPVYVDLVELRQVVINILLNAADAMPDGGTLTLITSRCAELPHLKHQKGATLRAPCVCLTIRDTGCGIKERHLNSIFDPFFTTKSKGSGLGLYNARIALEKHNGAIAVESAEGRGTSFHVYLPEADGSAAEPDDFDTQFRQAQRRSLLLLGQAGEMLDKTAELLRSNNYHVVVATTPESVPELLQSSDYHFAGVILLAEPNDHGMDSTVLEVRQQKRDIKVVLKLAGCTQDDVSSKILAKVDLVLGPEVSESDSLAKLGALFNP